MGSTATTQARQRSTQEDRSTAKVVHKGPPLSSGETGSSSGGGGTSSDSVGSSGVAAAVARRSPSSQSLCHRRHCGCPSPRWSPPIRACATAAPLCPLPHTRSGYTHTAG